MTSFHYSPPGLAASELMNDPRVTEARRLLLDAVQDHQRSITGIRPPHPALKQNYNQMLAAFAEDRGAPLWFPYIGSGLGKGPLVELADGSVKYDFICGIGPHYFGHNPPSLMQAGVEAAISNTVMQGNLQQNADSLELMDLLIKYSGLKHCFLSTSGAMANENALKIAFQKRSPAARLLAFDKCFTGRTLVLSQVTDKPAYRIGLPTLVTVDYVPFFDPDKPKESTERALQVLKKHLSRYPGQHAAMCFELVQGEGGFYSGTQEFYKIIMTLLKEQQIAIFADEVQSFGRTPALFAYQYFGLESFIDIASVGKLSQVCATLFTSEYKPQGGLLSQTFTGSTSAIKTSIVLLKALMAEGYFGEEGKIATLHRHFTTHLQKLSQKHPGMVNGPFGIGCMVAFTPYDGDTERATRFVHRLFEAGVLSFVAGTHPTRVRFLVPAGAASLQDIDHVVEIIEKTLLSEGEGPCT